MPVVKDKSSPKAPFLQSEPVVEDLSFPKALFLQSEPVTDIPEEIFGLDINVPILEEQITKCVIAEIVLNEGIPETFVPIKKRKRSTEKDTINKRQQLTRKCKNNNSLAEIDDFVVKDKSSSKTPLLRDEPALKDKSFSNTHFLRDEPDNIVIKRERLDRSCKNVPSIIDQSLDEEIDNFISDKKVNTCILRQIDKMGIDGNWTLIAIEILDD